MTRPARAIRSDIAWSTPTSITVRGRDLPGEILGRMDLGTCSFTHRPGADAGRAPGPQPGALASLVEHGLTLGLAHHSSCE